MFNNLTKFDEDFDMETEPKIKEQKVYCDILAPVYQD